MSTEGCKPIMDRSSFWQVVLFLGLPNELNLSLQWTIQQYQVIDTVCYLTIKALLYSPKMTGSTNMLKMETLLLSIALRKTWQPTFSPKLFPQWSRNISHNHSDLLACNCPIVCNDFKLMMIHDSPIGLNLALFVSKLYEYLQVCGRVLKYFNVSSWLFNVLPHWECCGYSITHHVCWLIQLKADRSGSRLYSINHAADP